MITHTKRRIQCCVYLTNKLPVIASYSFIPGHHIIVKHERVFVHIAGVVAASE